jgi:hypothetical protein
MASSALNMAYGTRCGRVVRGKEKYRNKKISLSFLVCGIWSFDMIELGYIESNFILTEYFDKVK